MVDPGGQRYNAHQVTHIPNVVGDVVTGYCALAVDITASIEGYEQARQCARAGRAAKQNASASPATSTTITSSTSSARARSGSTPRSSARRTRCPTSTLRPTRSIAPSRSCARRCRPGCSGSRSPAVRWPRSPSWPAAVSIWGRRTAIPACPVAAGDHRTRVVGRASCTRCWTCSRPRSRSGTRRSATSSPTARRCAGSAARDRADVRRPSTPGTCSAPGVFEAPTRPYAEAALLGEPQQFDRTSRTRPGCGTSRRTTHRGCATARIDGIYSFVVDVTPRVEAELALQDARAELATARERERIADDLHNLVIQRLFAAGLAATLPAAAVAEAQVRSVQDGIVAALADLESAMTSLHENVGLLDLLPELAHLVHDATQPNGIAATIENVGSVEYVPPAVGRRTAGRGRGGAVERRDPLGRAQRRRHDRRRRGRRVAARRRRRPRHRRRTAGQRHGRHGLARCASRRDVHMASQCAVRHARRLPGPPATMTSATQFRVIPICGPGTAAHPSTAVPANRTLHLCGPPTAPLVAPNETDQIAVERLLSAPLEDEVGHWPGLEAIAILGTQGQSPRRQSLRIRRHHLTSAAGGVDTIDCLTAWLELGVLGALCGR